MADIAPVSNALQAHAGMSLADYLARSDERFEIIDGEEVPMSPTGNRHDKLKQRLFLLLRDYAMAHSLGSIVIEHTFIDPEAKRSNWVRGSITPDVMFYSGTRLTEYDAVVVNTDDDNLPIVLLPDLVIEVISPTDTRRDISNKIGYMLDLGVKVVWSINPKRQSVVAYTPEDDPHTLKSADVLRTDLLPGWSIVVADLFNGKLGG